MIPGALVLSVSSSAARARPLLGFKAASDYEVSSIHPVTSLAHLFVCTALNTTGPCPAWRQTQKNPEWDKILYFFLKTRESVFSLLFSHPRLNKSEETSKCHLVFLGLQRQASCLKRWTNPLPPPQPSTANKSNNGELALVLVWGYSLSLFHNDVNFSLTFRIFYFSSF